MPYVWRKLTQEQREEVLVYRKLMRRPWHRPPHFGQGVCYYLMTAACYEHRPIIGKSPERMGEFSEALLDVFTNAPAAWCVLPNHYHVLVRVSDLKELSRDLGRLHGSMSRRWNVEEKTEGRKVWHGVSDRAMRNADHFWATVNYVHHNSVKHGYAEKWEEWPFSSAAGCLEEMGREGAKGIWERFPLGSYGEGWDEF